MQQRSGSLQNRLSDIESRLRSMRTVANTASAEISGGETVIDEDGSIFFSDGGRLSLGSSSIQSSTGEMMIDPEGNLSVDSLVVYGDILSASDYLYQREAIEAEIISTDIIEPVVSETTLGFPDWASSALVTFTIYVRARFNEIDSNPMLISLNGKPIARPRTDQLGNLEIDASVVRRVSPDTPNIRVNIDLSGTSVPTASPTISIKIGGVYSV